MVINGGITKIKKKIKRSEVAFINYLNLFLVHQIRDGKLEAAYQKHFGTSAPESLIQSLRDNK